MQIGDNVRVRAVRDVTTDAESLAIVRSTITLGHDLGLTVVAEGVEDRATWTLLGGLGCDVVQGYLVSRPVSAAELTRWLDTSLWVGNERTQAA